MTEYDFDIAVSFAAEDRDYVAKVVDKLKARGVSVFYDLDHTSEMWGEDLVGFLQDVYRRRARYAIFFVSANGAPTRTWRRRSVRSIQPALVSRMSTAGSLRVVCGPISSSGG